MSNAPIGLFDSGIGGTTIWRAIVDELPQENTIFIADSANAPYGEKSVAEIVALSKKHTENLLQQGCKLIVVACNTATTNAIATLRRDYPETLFIGIEPAIKPAALASQTGHIGILATKGTLASAMFHHSVQQHVIEQGIQLHQQIGHGLVELIEAGKLYSEEMSELLTTYLTPLIEANIDILVLGCTHYPYLRPQIQALLPALTILDSGTAVAKQTCRLLEQHHLQNHSGAPTKHYWHSTGNAKILKEFTSKTYQVRFDKT